MSTIKWSPINCKPEEPVPNTIVIGSPGNGKAYRELCELQERNKGGG